ncbi:uncharacterized protein LOC133491058 [Syngnathoides biaculeatus]|uniref:uncharacterized protein LOC133491058 n=1 Tax=Syngnathoides biaculeatus TaxID=300417 RepID=UPI002ADD7FF0|nr:uncharacterized protein LOC133491058 [Syngnathoides biaculeatus]XP_061657920.1 uncharacterized protein LOC133491058 [Syngnathoides biaculeatus]
MRDEGSRDRRQKQLNRRTQTKAGGQKPTTQFDRTDGERTANIGFLPALADYSQAICSHYMRTNQNLPTAGIKPLSQLRTSWIRPGSQKSARQEASGEPVMPRNDLTEAFSNADDPGDPKHLANPSEEGPTKRQKKQRKDCRILDRAVEDSLVEFFRENELLLSGSSIGKESKNNNHSDQNVLKKLNAVVLANTSCSDTSHLEKN